MTPEEERNQLLENKMYETKLNAGATFIAFAASILGGTTVLFFQGQATIPIISLGVVSGIVFASGIYVLWHKYSKLERLRYKR